MRLKSEFKNFYIINIVQFSANLKLELYKKASKRRLLAKNTEKIATHKRFHEKREAIKQKYNTLKKLKKGTEQL